MKLYINGRFLAQRISGVQRYGRELLRELDLLLAASCGAFKAEILVPRTVIELPKYEAISVRTVGVLRGHAWEQFELPFFCRGHVLFTPCSAAPLLHNANVVTIHDMAIFSAPSGYSFRYRVWYRILGRVLCRTALKILTVSQFSKSELLRWCHPDSEKIAVTYEGCEHVKAVGADPSTPNKFGLKAGKYVLAVGSKNPNKNFKGLVRALPYLRDLQYDVAVAGNTDDPVFRNSAARLIGVKDLGYVTEEELRGLYENAACFVFPSLYEGFGLPPLEALLLGCKVVVSDRASMREIFAGMATFCNPDDPEDIAKKIVATIADSGDDDEDREWITNEAAQFSWKRCARDTWSVLESSLLRNAEMNKANTVSASPLCDSPRLKPIDKE